MAKRPMAYHFSGHLSGHFYLEISSWSSSTTASTAPMPLTRLPQTISTVFDQNTITSVGKDTQDYLNYYRNSDNASFDEARYNLATRIMSNGVEVIIASDKIKAADYVNNIGSNNKKSSVLHFVPSQIYRPVTLAASTLKNQMFLAMPSSVQENFTIPIDSNQFITKTCLTTYTYRTTYMKNGRTAIESREHIISNIATEERNFLKLSSQPPLGITLTRTPELTVGVFPTTYSYYNTIMNGDVPLVTKSAYTVTNTITGPDNYISYLQPSEEATPVYNTNTYYSMVTLTKTIHDPDILKIVTTRNVLTQVIVTESMPPHGTSVLTSYYAYDVEDGEQTTMTIENENVFDVEIKPTAALDTKNSYPAITTSMAVASSSSSSSSIDRDLHIYATKTYLTTLTYFTTAIADAPPASDSLTSTVVNYHTRVIENIITETVPSTLLRPELITKFRSELKKAKNQRRVIVTVATLLGGQTLKVTAMKMLVSPMSTYNDNPKIETTNSTQTNLYLTDTVRHEINIENSSTRIPQNSLKPSTNEIRLPTVSTANETENEASDTIEENSNDEDDTDTDANADAIFEGSETAVVYVTPQLTKSNSTKTHKDPGSGAVTKPINTHLPQAVNQFIGSLNFKGLSALRPVINAMAGLLQNNFPTTAMSHTLEKAPESKNNIKNIPSNNISGTSSDRPIYIPVKNDAIDDTYRENSLQFNSQHSLDIQPPQTEFAVTYENWSHESNAHSDEAKLQVNLNKPHDYKISHIKISPGEVINTNSDVIVGKPNGIQHPRITVPVSAPGPVPAPPSPMSMPPPNLRGNPLIPRPVQYPIRTTFYKHIIQHPDVSMRNPNVIPLGTNPHNGQIENFDNILQPPPMVQKRQPPLQFKKPSMLQLSREHSILSPPPLPLRPLPPAPLQPPPPSIPLVQTQSAVSHPHHRHQFDAHLSMSPVPSSAPSPHQYRLPSQNMPEYFNNLNRGNDNRIANGGVVGDVAKVVDGDHRAPSTINGHRQHQSVDQTDSSIPLGYSNVPSRPYIYGQRIEEPPSSGKQRPSSTNHQQISLDTNTLSHNVDINVPPLTFKKETDYPLDAASPIRGQIPTNGKKSHQDDILLSSMPHVKIPINEQEVQINLTSQNTIDSVSMHTTRDEDAGIHYKASNRPVAVVGAFAVVDSHLKTEQGGGDQQSSFESIDQLQKDSNFKLAYLDGDVYAPNQSDKGDNYNHNKNKNNFDQNAAASVHNVLIPKDSGYGPMRQAYLTPEGVFDVNEMKESIKSDRTKNREPPKVGHHQTNVTPGGDVLVLLPQKGEPFKQSPIAAKDGGSNDATVSAATTTITTTTTTRTRTNLSVQQHPITTKATFEQVTKTSRPLPKAKPSTPAKLPSHPHRVSSSLQTPNEIFVTHETSHPHIHRGVLVNSIPLHKPPSTSEMEPPMVDTLANTLLQKSATHKTLMSFTSNKKRIDSGYDLNPPPLPPSRLPPPRSTQQTSTTTSIPYKTINYTTIKRHPFIGSDSLASPSAEPLPPPPPQVPQPPPPHTHQPPPLSPMIIDHGTPFKPPPLLSSLLSLEPQMQPPTTPSNTFHHRHSQSHHHQTNLGPIFISPTPEISSTPFALSSSIKFSTITSIASTRLLPIIRNPPTKLKPPPHAKTTSHIRASQSHRPSSNIVATATAAKPSTILRASGSTNAYVLNDSRRVQLEPSEMNTQHRSSPPKTTPKINVSTEFDRTKAMLVATNITTAPKMAATLKTPTTTTTTMTTAKNAESESPTPGKYIINTQTLTKTKIYTSVLTTTILATSDSTNVPTMKPDADRVIVMASAKASEKHWPTITATKTQTLTEYQTLQRATPNTESYTLVTTIITKTETITPNYTTIATTANFENSKIRNDDDEVSKSTTINDTDNSIFVVMTNKNAHHSNSVVYSTDESDDSLFGVGIGTTAAADIELDYDESVNVNVESKYEKDQLLLGGVLIATPSKGGGNRSLATMQHNEAPVIDANLCVPACKTSRNEFCSQMGSTYQCSCRPGFARMFADRPCKPTYTFVLQIPIQRIDQYDLHYDHALFARNDTPDYRQLAAITHDAVDRMVMQSDFRDIYNGVHLTHFAMADADSGPQTELTANFLLQLSGNSNEMRLENVFKKYLRRSNYSIGGTDLYTSRSGVEALTVDDFDECSHKQFHDCSINAHCFNLQGTYTCSCKEGFDDITDNTIYPGRFCSAEIIGCEKCNYHGKCSTKRVSNDVVVVCECFAWYTGATCQLNLKLFLIALTIIGTILLILLLFCVLLTYTKYHRKRQTTNTTTTSTARPSLFAAIPKVTVRNGRFAAAVTFNGNERRNDNVKTDKRAIIKDSSSDSSQNSLPYVLKKDSMTHTNQNNRQSLIKNITLRSNQHNKDYHALLQQHEPQIIEKSLPVTMNVTEGNGDHGVGPSYVCRTEHQTYPEQTDRSLTVMIPRAKYHHLSILPRNQLIDHQLTIEKQIKFEELSEAVLTTSSGQVHDIATLQCIPNEIRSTVNCAKNYNNSGGGGVGGGQEKSEGALISAGFEVSTIVGAKLIDGQRGNAPPRSSDIASGGSLEIRAINGTEINGQNGMQFHGFKCEKELMESMDIWLDNVQTNELSAEARSCDETTVHAPTKTMPMGFDMQHNPQANDDANTMAERDLGSTFLLPHTHLYKPERHDSDISGFDSC